MDEFEKTPLWISLACGGFAGTSVDITLFPLDTLKTRLQSPFGFKASGGFSRIYSGIGPAALGSAPSAALFFLAYDQTKSLDALKVAPETLRHASAAALGETFACFLRVPIEIVKQRRQALGSPLSSLQIAREILITRGVFRGIYRGYFTTVSREIPFSFIQFPLWEGLKSRYTAKKKGPPSTIISAVFGALSGGVAAGLTTPLDVAKTRIMLSDDPSTKSTFKVLRDVYVAGKIRGLFAGVLPRITWMSLGGFIFLGAYEGLKNFLAF